MQDAIIDWVTLCKEGDPVRPNKFGSKEVCRGFFNGHTLAKTDGGVVFCKSLLYPLGRRGMKQRCIMEVANVILGTNNMVMVKLQEDGL